MKKRGRPKKRELVVTDQQKIELKKLARQRKNRNLSFRSKIILKCNDGLSNATVAREVKTTGFTVGFWRNRFIKNGIDSLYDEARPGAPRQVVDSQVAKVIKATLESKPKGSTHWSTLSMAKKMGLSQTMISRIWRAFGLQPDRSETFQLSTDPYFIEKVKDVVGLYMNPPANALVLSVDEKSQIQALNRTQLVLPMRPGQVERQTHEYHRNGVTSLFAALDVATGNVIGKCFKRHRSIEFKKFLNHIDKKVAKDLDIHIILDNYGTHKTKIIKDWLHKRPRYHLHFIPTHSSWLNQIERWFAMLTEKKIKRGSHYSVKDLEKAIKEFIKNHNDNPKPFIWTKTAEQIISKVKRFAEKTMDIHGK